MHTLRVLFVAALALTSAACAMRSPAPVPPEAGVSVTAPTGVPADVAAFSGRWQGTWDDKVDHTLVVEQITGNQVQTFYSVGDSSVAWWDPIWMVTWPSAPTPEWRYGRGFARVQGTVENGALTLRSPKPGVAMYRMRPDGKLDATYEAGGRTARAVMTKVPHPAPTAP